MSVHDKQHLHNLEITGCEGRAEIIWKEFIRRQGEANIQTYI